MMVHHHKPEIRVKNLIIVFKVKVSVKVYNVNDWLSGQYVLNH